MKKSIFYTERKELNEVTLPFAYYNYCIDWNVKNITYGQERDGYIVQKVHFESELECIGGCDDYYEAWKVQNNTIIDKDDRPDDTFCSGGTLFLNILLEGSIGKKAKTIYKTEVYWVNKSDQIYEIIDSWKPRGAIVANELKSVYVKDAKDFKCCNFICDRFFEHITDCTNFENVRKSIIYCYERRLNNKDHKMKDILKEILDGTEFEILVKDILELYGIVN